MRINTKTLSFIKVSIAQATARAYNTKPWSFNKRSKLDNKKTKNQKKLSH